MLVATNSFMGYQNVWLQNDILCCQQFVLVAKNTSCAISTVLLIWLQKMASSARGYQSIWLQKVASLAWLPITGIHYLVAKDTLCYQFQFYQVGRDVLCSPCMQQAGRDVLYSPHINSIGCRLQELYCAHHVFVQ